MCHYEACLCKRASKRCHNEHKVNYKMPVEWTGTCDLRPDQEFKKAWTLVDFPPEWFCGEKVLVESKDIRYAAICADCKAARKEKMKRRAENRKKKAQDKKERLADESAESSRQGTPMGLKRSYTFRSAATQSLMLLKLRRLMKMKAQSAKEGEANAMKRSVTRLQERPWV